jgi:hypothetical protein
MIKPEKGIVPAVFAAGLFISLYIAAGYMDQIDSSKEFLRIVGPYPVVENNLVGQEYGKAVSVGAAGFFGLGLLVSLLRLRR